MNKATLNTAILSITLNRSSNVSLQSQLTQAIRVLVHERKLRPGDKLPSSRTFAQELSVSRVTITAVFDQLEAEGYLEGRRGSGVFVASNLPDLPITVPSNKPPVENEIIQPARQVRPFDTASPELKEFPHREWAKLFDQIWRNPSDALLSKPDPMGWGPLRAEISEHLRVWRGIQCSPSQIVVTSGLVEALELIGGSILAAGDHVLMEEPGHQVIQRTLTSKGLRCHHIRVDDLGFDVELALENRVSFKAVFLTPSRHFPLGMTLPLSRRLHLLAWAPKNSAYIVEDDFDGEFRYQGQPLPAMMSLDERGRVIYVGSFSKVIFPALRLGFVVLPNPLIEPISQALAQSGQRTSLIAQPVLAQFMSSGGFATHIRRMRRLYSERQKAMLAAIERHAIGILEVDAEPGGMHLVARLGAKIAPHLSDVEASRLAHEAGVSARALSQFFAGPADAQGLVLGYSAFPAKEIKEAVIKLAGSLAAN